MRKFILILLAITFILTSCEKTPEAELVGDPLKFIEDYITSAVPGIHFVNVGFSDNHEIYIFAFLHDYVEWSDFGEKAWSACDAAKLALSKAGCKLDFLSVFLNKIDTSEDLYWVTYNLKKGDLSLSSNGNLQNKGSYSLKRLSKEYSSRNITTILKEFESLKNSAD